MEFRYWPKCEFPKLIIWHNIGPISAAKSRLLSLGQWRRLHRSSAGPMTPTFVGCLNLPNFSRNLAHYRPYIKPIVTFTMASSSESRRASVQPKDGTLLGHMSLFHGKTFWGWENQSPAQHRPVDVPKTNVAGQSLGHNWPPSAYWSYDSSNGTILATDLRQKFCRR